MVQCQLLVGPREAELGPRVNGTVYENIEELHEYARAIETGQNGGQIFKSRP